MDSQFLWITKEDSERPNCEANPTLVGDELTLWFMFEVQSLKLEQLKVKRTFQPNNRRKAKVHGFRERMRTRAGRAVLAARRRKGRVSVSVSSR